MLVIPALVPVVGRAKQCWDFAATVYIMDLLACTLYTRFPKVRPPHRMTKCHRFMDRFWTDCVLVDLQGTGAGMWWATQFLGGTVTSLVGEFFCMKYEMREISIVALAGVRTQAI